jgi:acyl dehydratase
MAIDPDYLISRQFPTITETYNERDCMLYALGVGMGQDPLDRNCLPFVYEKSLKVMPSQPVVMAHPGFWAAERDIDLDWVKLLQTEQELIIHQPFPGSGTVAATTRLTEVIDKGERIGALIKSERTIRNVDTGADLCTVRTTVLARGDGGFGGARKVTPKTDPIPSREPDKVCDLPTLPQQALIYRLAGDLNPLHSDPEVAARAGFKAPILHGLCTMGVMTHALLKLCANYEPERFRHIRLRFSAPVYPGETIRTEVWQDGDAYAFRCKSVEQDKIVINNGYLLID